MDQLPSPQNAAAETDTTRRTPDVVLPDSAPAPSPVPAPLPIDRATPVDRLPPFALMLHNDDAIAMDYVVETICDLTPLDRQRASTVMIEAHTSGLALVLTTHKERAELFAEQFRSKGLTVSIEPATI